MPSLTFSAPNLAVVAYAEVDGATGASTRTNSGVTTTRNSLGLYAVILPTNQGQYQASDLILVQAVKAGAPTQGPVDVVINDNFGGVLAPFVKVVEMWDGSPHGGSTPPVQATKIDSDFHILILRSTLTPPTGAPA